MAKDAFAAAVHEFGWSGEYIAGRAASAAKMTSEQVAAKNIWLGGIALTAAIVVSLVLGGLVSNQGLGLMPGSAKFFSAVEAHRVGWHSPVYSLFLGGLEAASHKGLPGAARWPQIILLGIVVAVAAATIQWRSIENFVIPLLTALLIAIAPEVLRTFTVLSPQTLVIFFAVWCLFASEQAGRRGGFGWLSIAIVAGVLAGLSDFSASVLFALIPIAEYCGKRSIAAWGHLAFAILYPGIRLAIDHHADISAPASIGFVIFIASAVQTRKGGVLLGLLLILRCAFGVPWIIRAERFGHDYAEVSWKHSQTIGALHPLRSHQPIFSNIPEPLLLHSNHPVMALADTDWNTLRQALTTTDSFVVLFGDASEQLTQINAHVPLEEYRALSDGEILRADVSVWNGKTRAKAFSERTPSIPARRAAGHFEWWNQKHDGYVAQAAKGNIDLLFLGDSITDDFRKVPGAWDFFEQRFGKYHAANFGIDGDHTQHLLFRILNGECDHISPRVAVILIGTNNTADDSAAAIAKGIQACVSAARAKMPHTRILLLGLFPRGESPTNNDKRPVIQEVNQRIARLDNGNTVRFLNLYDKFLAPDGSLSKQIMYDGLHPSLQGYHIWLDAMQPLLDQMMASPPATAP